MELNKPKFFSEPATKKTTQAQEQAFDSTLKGDNRAKQFIIPRVPNDFKEYTIPEPHEIQSECTTGCKYISQNRQRTKTSAQSQERALDTNLKDANGAKQVNLGKSPPTILSNTNNSMDFRSNKHVDCPNNRNEESHGVCHITVWPSMPQTAQPKISTFFTCFLTW